MFVGRRKFHTPPIPISYSTPRMAKTEEGDFFYLWKFCLSEAIKLEKGFYKQTSLNLCSNMTAKIKWICDLSNFISINVISFDMWNVGDFTWSSWISMCMLAKLKKGIKNLSSVTVNVLRKMRIGTNFSRRSRAIKFDGPCRVVVFGCYNPTRYCFTFSLPSSTLYCLKSLVTFRGAGLLYLWPLYIRVNSRGVGHL